MNNGHAFDNLFGEFVETFINGLVPKETVPDNEPEQEADESYGVGYKEYPDTDWTEEKTKVFVDGLPFAKIVTCGTRYAILISGEVIFLEDDSLVEPLVNAMRRGHSEAQN